MFLVRPELPADAVAIRSTHRLAFGAPTEAQLVDALRAAGQTCVSLVADIDGSVTGHVMLSPVELAGTGAPDGGLGLAPLAVRPSRQSRGGVGGWLVVAALAAARRPGRPFVVVLGDPAWYARCGFEPAARYGLSNESGAGDEFMVLLLRPGALPPAGGLIRYRAEFAVMDTMDRQP
jgi:putative acetyltransferase